jgi:hypothetical protein
MLEKNEIKFVQGRKGESRKIKENRKLGRKVCKYKKNGPK